MFSLQFLIPFNLFLSFCSTLVCGLKNQKNIFYKKLSVFIARARVERIDNNDDDDLDDLKWMKIERREIVDNKHV